MCSRERLTKERKRNVNQIRDGTDRIRQNIVGVKIPRKKATFSISLCGQVLLAVSGKMCEILKVPPHLEVGKAALGRLPEQGVSQG